MTGSLLESVAVLSVWSKDLPTIRCMQCRLNIRLPSGGTFSTAIIVTDICEAPVNRSKPVHNLYTLSQKVVRGGELTCRNAHKLPMDLAWHELQPGECHGVVRRWERREHDCDRDAEAQLTRLGVPSTHLCVVLR